MEAEEFRDIARLAAHFLEDLSEKMGNAGCNDWDWPEWVPDPLRRELWEAGDGGPNDDISSPVMDFMVIGGLIKKLKTLAETL